MFEIGKEKPADVSSTHTSKKNCNIENSFYNDFTIFKCFAIVQRETKKRKYKIGINPFYFNQHVINTILAPI